MFSLSCRSQWERRWKEKKKNTTFLLPSSHEKVFPFLYNHETTQHEFRFIIKTGIPSSWSSNFFFCYQGKPFKNESSLAEIGRKLSASYLVTRTIDLRSDLKEACAKEATREEENLLHVKKAEQQKQTLAEINSYLFWPWAFSFSHSGSSFCWLSPTNLSPCESESKHWIKIANKRLQVPK